MIVENVDQKLITSLRNNCEKSNIILIGYYFIKVVVELLKLPNDFWLSALKADCISPDEQQLHSTPTQSQPQTPGSYNRFFSSG